MTKYKLLDLVRGNTVAVLRGCCFQSFDGFISPINNFIQYETS